MVIHTREQEDTPRLTLRDARDDDAEGVIALIGAVFAEYPGVILDVDGEAPELRHIASWAREQGGAFWVAERQGRIVGTCGVTRLAPGAFELRKLYVDREERQRGLAGRLVALVETFASDHGGRSLELWSDVKFETAHAFYERRGFVRGGTRRLDDKSDTVEHQFRKELGK